MHVQDVEQQTLLRRQPRALGTLMGTCPPPRAMLDVQRSAEQLARFFRSSVGLMQVLARACGHDDLAGFCRDDITTWSREMADLSGIEFAGFDPAR